MYSNLSQFNLENKTIECDIPLNTNIAKKDIVMDHHRLSMTLEPVDFLEKICMIMGLDRKAAHLAYKLNGEARSTPPHILQTDRDVNILYEHIRELRQRATKRSKEIKVEIINRVCSDQVFPVD